MKKLAIITAALLCALSLASCGLEARDILDGDGNAVATGYYDKDRLVYEEILDKNGDVSKKTAYDEEGRVSTVESYRLGELSEKTEYVYTDKKGEYTSKTSAYSKKGDLLSVTETEIKDGRTVKEILTKPTESGVDYVSECTFIYKEDGTVAMRHYSLDTLWREVLEDGNGVMIYDKVFNEDGSSTRTVYTDGKTVAKVEIYNSNDQVVLTTVNTYGEDGKIAKTHTYDKDSVLKDYSEYVYGDTSLKAVYRYAKDGTITASIIYDENGKSTIHENEYVPVD